MSESFRCRNATEPDRRGAGLVPRASCGHGASRWGIRRASAPGGPRPGFTLAELLMVLVVIGILAAVAAPRIDAMEYRMRGAVQEIGTTLLAAQRRAVMRQHDIVVAIDTVGRRLRVHEDADGDGAIDEGELVRNVGLADAVRFGLGGAPARPMGGAPVMLTRTQGGLPALTFHRDGSASEEGGFYVTSLRAQRSGAFATDTHAVEVARSTGRAAWYRFGGTRWERRF